MNPSYLIRQDTSPLKELNNAGNQPGPDSARKPQQADWPRPHSPINMGSNRKQNKRMWEYDWTLLIPETHKQSGCMF